MGLPCAHEIQARWYDNAGGNVLKLEDIHPHWLFDKPPRARLIAEEEAKEQDNDEMGGNNLDDATIISDTHSAASSASIEDSNLPGPSDLLRIHEPAIVKPKGRPPGAPNNIKGVQPHICSTVLLTGSDIHCRANNVVVNNGDR